MSRYLFTNYQQYRSNETITYDTDKIDDLKLKMDKIRKKLYAEKDPNLRRRYEMEIKVCQLKIMIAQIK